MSHYKITYESNTIEGLKAIQGSSAGPGASANDSTTFETQVPPPPAQQDGGNADAFLGIVQAPPTADKADASLDFSSENAFYPPPPKVADSAIMDIGLEGEIPSPPKK